MLIVMLLIFSGCARELKQDASAVPESAVSIVVASDIHYLSPLLTDYGDYFMDLIARADGKVTHYTPELVKAFVAQVQKEGPDAVVISGDLTLNGGEASHRELAELLKPLKEAGILVLVLPGNHDVNHDAYEFSGEEVTAIAGTDTEAFMEIYKEMGYGEVLSRDGTSLSYIAEIGEHVRLLMVDVNAAKMSGSVNEETFVWAEEQLKAAKEQGATVIGVTHQNVLIHNPRFTFGYQLNNADKLFDLYERYGVTLNLSGHLHLQNIAEKESLTEIVTSSMAVAPNQYGVLKVAPDGSMTYTKETVDVGSWAEENGITDENLLNFTDYAIEFFKNNSGEKLAGRLAELEIEASSAEP